MRTRRVVFFVALIILCVWSSNGYSLKEETHRAVNEHVAQNTVSGFSLNRYLMNNFGFKNGGNELFNGVNAKGGRIYKEIFWWLGYGGEQEDRPGAILDYITQKPTRSFNHFHNPLKPSWNEAGLNDYILVPIVAPFPPFPAVSYTKKWYTGQSSILWSQNSQQSVGGQWSWSNARNYFYDALTLKVKNQRDSNFADTFRAVGQLMHLVHDSSVPEHIRNDIHVLPSFGDNYPAYEQQVEDFRSDKINYGVFWNNLLSNPIPFDKSVLDAPSYNAYAPFPISRIIDADLYTGNNPVITATAQNSPQKIGLSEYANANFISKDTAFETESPHGFPYPRVEDLTWWIDGSKWYLKKEGSGDTINHFLRTSWLYWYRWKLFPQYKQYLPVGQDKECFKEYAQKLVPRAVGYSAALLDYFFRGDIRLEYTTVPRPGFVIKNKTDENMDGLFQVLYDNKNDQRVKIMSGNFSLGKQSAGAVFDITHPIDAKEPGKYIIAFRGTMGNEKEAVAGYVTTRLLEITPPAQFIYSMTDGSGADPYFRNIRAKVKNASPGEQMKTGTILAVAKYKLDTADPVFLYSISDPQPIDLSSGDPAELNFDFDNDPIPLDITDLYLEVVFKGTIGNETDAIASGIKDISEPTPIDIFNDTDKSCINGVWYPAADAIDLMDTHWPKDHIADTWDVNPHLLKDIYIKLSPMTNPEMASSTVYNSMVPFLYPGEFRQAMYMLSDYRFKYSFHETWSGAPGYTDYGQHGIRVSTYEGTAVTNQTDYTSDPATCGRNILCSIYRYPVYYSLRNYQMWWGGGLVYINWPYPYNSSCQGF